MTRADRNRRRSIEALVTEHRGRDPELGYALSKSAPGDSVVVHELDCKWNRPRGSCRCTRITLVTGATA